MKSAFSKLLTLATITAPAFASFHLVHYSEVIVGSEEPLWYSAAIHEMTCSDLDHSTVALSVNEVDDPLPNGPYPWWTTEFQASTCHVDLDFGQNGEGDFLVYIRGGGFQGYCRKGSGQQVTCFDGISSSTMVDDYFCDVPVCS